MVAAEGLLTALERNWDMVDVTLEGLDDATLARQPSPQTIDNRVSGDEASSSQRKKHCALFPDPVDTFC